VTRPFLYFSPDPKHYFLHLNTEKNWSDCYALFKKISKNVFKHLCKHSQNKIKLDNFNFSFVILIKEGYILKIAIHCMCQLFDFETLDIQSFWVFLYVSKCVHWSAGYFLEHSCLILNNETYERRTI